MTKPTYEPACLAFSHRHELFSQKIGEVFQIDVALPPAAPPPEGYPVVYLMDGNSIFGTATETIRLLTPTGELPPMLLVGVGYQLAGPVRQRRDLGRLRTRDLSPSLDRAYLDQVMAGSPGADPRGDIKLAGGAEDFLDFLIHDLRPFIASLYPTNPSDQTLFGNSLGGLYSLHTLLTRPGVFQRHIASSPAIWWDDKALFMLEASTPTTTPLSAKLFLSVGSLETHVPYDMVINHAELTARLLARRDDSLVLTSHVFEKETHGSVIPAAISRGLRSVFA